MQENKSLAERLRLFIKHNNELFPFPLSFLSLFVALALLLPPQHRRTLLLANERII